MPQYRGVPVAWGGWELDLTIVCPPQKGCAACGKYGTCIARAHTTPGSYDFMVETFKVPTHHRVGGRRTMTVDVKRSATPRVVVFAFRCAHCGDTRFLDYVDADHPVSVIVCDDCDSIAAVGFDDSEARDSLIALGGWTGGPDTDWDRCSSCAHDGVLRVVRPTRRSQ